MTAKVTIDGPGGANRRTRALAEHLPSVLVVGGAVVGAVAGMWAASLPGGSLLLIVGAFWLWVAAGLGWLVLVGFHVLGRSPTRVRPRLWGVVIAPVLVLATIGLVVTDAPLRARWAASDQAFARVVDDARRDAPEGPRVQLPVPGRLGLYRVSEAYQLGDGIFFVVLGGGGLMSAEGFAHLPTGPSPMLAAQHEGVTFRSIGNDWYAWSASM